jgi:hypothetical protein
MDWSDDQESKEDGDATDTGLPDAALDFDVGRPQLHHNSTSQPLPLEIGDPRDSLSLLQLRKVVTEFSKPEPVNSSFDYADSASFGEEVDEWFTGDVEALHVHLGKIRAAFEAAWRVNKTGESRRWINANKVRKMKLISDQLNLLNHDISLQIQSLQVVFYICFGAWGENNLQEEMVACDRSSATIKGIEFLMDDILLLVETGGVDRIYKVFQHSFERRW